MPTECRVNRKIYKLIFQQQFELRYNSLNTCEINSLGSKGNNFKLLNEEKGQEFH